MKAIALLSGGLDSTVNFKRAVDEGHVALALTFNYGQRSAQREIEAASAIASRFGVAHKAIALPWLAEITTTALVDSGKDLPTPSDDELDTAGERTAIAVWVPNRNGVLINIAAAHAEAMGCDSVVVGFNSEEGATFPDNTPEFVGASNGALAYSTLSKVRVVCHTIEMNKAQVVRFGREIDAPINLVWPCYEAGPGLCWKCESCRRFRRALIQTGNLEWYETLRAK
ncbi:MAG: 7-cyano-7-deazaguanine synthase QueC [Planctomycetes bacterium]|nr:7-cyano-7-deazaguanine synthase QueC [Planctomycetota bacterium]